MKNYFGDLLVMSTNLSFIILVVDDEKDTLDLLTLLLTGENYQVLTASDVKEATSILINRYNNQELLPDLILLDIKMPGINGYDFCEFIKERVSFSKIPVVFISALTFKKDIERGLKCGALDFVKKPWSSNEELINRIKRILSFQPVSSHI